MEEIDLANTDSSYRENILGIDQTHYYGPDEMEKIITCLAKDHPDLVQLYSIGKSIRGRDLWMVELTNTKSGPAEEKPGELVFAMTHAAEIMGAAAALYAICDAVDRYGKDVAITDLLNRNVLYIMPFLNPDGGEIALNTPYRWVGNGRFLPGEEQPLAGMYQCDIDEDGRILEMRVEDSAGEWKVSDRDPRLLIPRQPGDRNGPFYRRLPEGLIRDFDGAELWLPKPRDGNLNRNFPENWGPEFRQDGAGEHPMSEPEVAAFVRFVLDHPNIVGSLSLHTNAGAILFPNIESSRKRDLLAFRRFAQKGSEITGYGIIESVLDQFTTDRAKPRLGVGDEWLYKQRGLICFTIELWDWLGTAGVKRDSFMMSLTGPKEEEELQILKWNDEVMNGEGFVEWYPFEHPQLGKVEIGGWTYMWPTRNAPPGDLLTKEVHKLAQFVFTKAASAPRLRIDSVVVELIEDDLYQVEAIVANIGFLPTYVSDQAREVGLAEPLRVVLTASDGIDLLDSAEQELDHLAGWSERVAPWVPWNYLEWEPTKRKVSWRVRARRDGKMQVTVCSRQAGRDEVSVAFVRLI